MNINDPDGFIWVPTYIAVGILPLVQKAKQQYLNIFATLIFIIGSLIFFGFFNSNNKNNCFTFFWRREY